MFHSHYDPASVVAGRPHIDNLIVCPLIAKGDDANAKDSRGQTPLHVAAESGHDKMAGLLIAQGADVNARNSKDKTPLQIAERAIKETLAKILRGHEARE